MRASIPTPPNYLFPLQDCSSTKLQLGFPSLHLFLYDAPFPSLFLAVQSGFWVENTSKKFRAYCRLHLSPPLFPPFLVPPELTDNYVVFRPRCSFRYVALPEESTLYSSQLVNSPLTGQALKKQQQGTQRKYPSSFQATYSCLSFGLFSTEYLDTRNENFSFYVDREVTHRTIHRSAHQHSQNWTVSVKHEDNNLLKRYTGATVSDGI